MDSVVVKLSHIIARVVKRIEVRAGRRATFGTAVAAPFVNSSSRLLELGSNFSVSWRPRRRVVASSSIPQGVRCFHNSRNCLVVVCSDPFPHGRR